MRGERESRRWGDAGGLLAPSEKECSLLVFLRQPERTTAEELLLTKPV